MAKQEPRYKTRKSTILRVQNGRASILSRDFPSTKKGLETSIVKDWIDYHKARNRKILIKPFEYPDFVIKDNGVVKGLELRRLTSRTEERNQAVSAKYRELLQKIYGDDFQFEFLPIKYLNLPNPTTKDGATLLEDVKKIVEREAKDGGNWNLPFNDYFRICFSFDMDTGLFNPQPLKEYYEEWYIELYRKWKSDFKVDGKGESILLLYRTGSNLNENILKDMVKSLNKKLGENFKEIWYLNAKSIGSIIVNLFGSA